MTSWGARRKLLYLAFIFFFGILSLALLVAAFWYEKPTCFDNKKNQDEIGVDCGGSCSTVCNNAVGEVEINWVRFFKIKDGLWSAAAYAENPNKSLCALSTPYRFKLYDSQNVLLAERAGKVYVPQGQAFGILEGSINLGERIPSRVTFEWEDEPNWVEYTGMEKTVYIKEISRSFDLGGLLRVFANVYNGSLKSVQRVVGFAVVYDLKGNVVSVSRTILDSIGGGQTEQFVFSWPVPFTFEIGRVDVLHWILPQGESL